MSDTPIDEQDETLTNQAGADQTDSEAVESGGEERSRLDQEGDIAADYLEGLLDILDVDGDIEIDVEAGRPLVSVVEARRGELDKLVGADGEVLAAVQDLTRLAVARETGDRSRLIVDIAGHRSKKKDSLRAIGLAAVRDARENQEAVRLQAMTAFERKIVHDVVAEEGLISESEGTEPNRYVVVRTP
mgnify:CR=1 FL=1